jgi:predicted RNase H-like HicB family nuclease
MASIVVYASRRAMAQYIALIRQDPDGDFGVSFPDLPGCISVGATLGEARNMAAKALALQMEGLAEDGQAPSEPSTFEAISTDPDNLGGLAILVRSDVKDA